MTTTTLLHIKVTEDHIARGVQKNPCSCPIALALRDAGCANPFVDIGYMEADIGDVEFKCYEVPQRVVNAILEFDSDGTMDPFEADLEIAPAADWEKQ